MGESHRKWMSEGGMPREEQERMNWEEGTGCQRRARDPERACGTQGIESWKEWGGGRGGENLKQSKFEERQICEESVKKGGRENGAEAVHGGGISNMNACSWQREGCRRREGAR